MPSRTDVLGLVLPGFGEYSNSWQTPINENFTAVDTAVGELKDELSEARQQKLTLEDYLSVGINVDGSLKATPEVASARNSFTYGYRDAAGAPLTLVGRLNSVDKEAWYAREQSATLLANLAARNLHLSDCIISGSKTNAGRPSWMGSSGASITVSGVVSPTTENLKLMIGGYLCRVRTLKTVALSGATGTKYIFATRSDSGVVIVDGDSAESGSPPAGVGTVSSDTASGDAIIFGDITVNFVTSGVQAGDLLTLVDTAAKGVYVIKELVTGTTNQLKIVGNFPVSTMASINYKITDPLGVDLSFETTDTATANKLCIGEAYFDGTAVDSTKIKARHFKDTYVSDWRTIDVSSSSSTLAQTFDHCLRSDVLSVSVQVRQPADVDADGYVEELSIADVASNFSGVTVSRDTLSFNPATLSVSGATVGGTATMTGGPSINMDGATVKPTRSVLARWTKNTLEVKGARPGVFYTDYSGATKTTGQIRVVVRKRG